MKRTNRAALFACAAIASLAFAGSALASFAPKLVVSSSGGQASGGSTRIGVVVSNADDPTAKVSIYIPAAYTVASASPGKLGDVTATANASDVGGILLPLTGELDAIAPTTATNAAAQACGVSPGQTWDLHLTAAGQPLDIPVFVVAASAPEIAVGYSTKLVVCLPPPDVPVGTPGRAVMGAKLLTATFTSSAITQPTSPGDYRWTSLWTPYTPGKGTPNAAGTVESQSVRHLPAKVALSVTKRKVTTVKRHKVRGKIRIVKTVSTVVKFSAKTTTNGQAPASATVHTTAAGKRFGASGSFILKSGKSATIAATATVDSESGFVDTGSAPNPAADLNYHDFGQTSCVGTVIFGGLPCIDLTAGGEILKATTTVKGYK